MNTQRVLRFPMIGLMIVALILLAVTGLALLVSVAWPLIHIPSGPSPIQADPLEVVNAFHTAINSDNPDCVLSLFVDDATITDDSSVIEGRDEIRHWLLYSQRMAGLRLTMLHSQVAGEKIFWNDIAHKGPEVQHRSYILRWIAVIQKGRFK